MSDQIIAIDLGTRSTKAVCVEKEKGSLRLVSYTLRDRPESPRHLPPDALAKHLSAVLEALNAKTNHAILVLGAGESLLCHSEMPLIDPSQMRKMVKLNPKLYFQEELPNHSFDCLILHHGKASPLAGKNAAKAKTLIVAARNQVLKTLKSAADSADLVLEQVTTSQTGAANSFLTSPEAANKDVVALIDIGFSNSTISLLVSGEIVLTRVVNIGADKFTSGLAEAMSITYSVAEGLKQIMPDKVHSQLKTLIAPLVNELSNSIHFFEQKEDKKVSEIFVSGGSARSKFILEILQNELHLPCKTWDPTGSLTLNFTEAQLAALHQEAPQLAVAIGAAVAWFKPRFNTIDLLAEQREEAELRSRDPMKRGYVLAAVMVLSLLCWYAFILYQTSVTKGTMTQLSKDMKSSAAKFAQADSDVQKWENLGKTLNQLNRIPQTRFLLAPALNALQYTVVDNFQVVRLQINQQLAQTKENSSSTNLAKVLVSKQEPEKFIQTVFTIQAKSTAKPSAAEDFMNALDDSPWFKANLRSYQPVRLKESQAAQVDPTDPNKINIFFTVECYAEHKL